MRWRRRDKRATGSEPQAGRIDRALFPLFGPAQVGPYDEPAQRPEPVDLECSICFRPMSLHTTDRSGGRSRVICPRHSPEDLRSLPRGG